MVIFLGGNYPKGHLSRGQLSGRNHPGENYLGDNYLEVGEFSLVAIVLELFHLPYQGQTVIKFVATWR